MTWFQYTGTIGLALSMLCSAMAAEETGEPSTEQRAAHLARMKELAASIHVHGNPERKGPEVQLVPEPVLRYSDTTRRLYESSLWIWGGRGRPAAILAVEYYAKHDPGPRWLFEIASLSSDRITADRGKELRWTATQPGLKLQPITGDDKPADKPARRLAQMKELRRRFAAHENAIVGGRIELRPLTSPLYRYADSSIGLADGALFTFANGTNPEVLLALEAHGPSDKPNGWFFGLAQMTGAAVFVEFDGKQIWTRGDADPPAVRDNYVNGWIPSQTPASQE